MLEIGLVFLVMETIKQMILIGHGYNVWYFPFQLCSMPMYLCLIAGILEKRGQGLRIQKVIRTFLMDYGMLGGIAALSYSAGFTDTGILYISIHGYVWHILMIVLAVYIYLKDRADLSLRGFLKATGLFGLLALLAEVINVLLHPFGDCDMFYISPYHYSSQPFFSTVDQMIGRIPGIIFYLLMIVVGAAIIHYILYITRFIVKMQTD